MVKGDLCTYKSAASYIFAGTRYNTGTCSNLAISGLTDAPVCPMLSMLRKGLFAVVHPD